MTKVMINQRKCIGCGTCQMICPQCFKIGASGKAETKICKLENPKKIKEAVKSCPVGAITLKDH